MQSNSEKLGGVLDEVEIMEILSKDFSVEGGMSTSERESLIDELSRLTTRALENANSEFGEGDRKAMVKIIKALRHPNSTESSGILDEKEIMEILSKDFSEAGGMSPGEREILTDELSRLTIAASKKVNSGFTEYDFEAILLSVDRFFKILLT